MLLLVRLTFSRFCLQLCSSQFEACLHFTPESPATSALRLLATVS